MRSPKSPGDGNDREKRVCHRREGRAVLRSGVPCINHTSPCLSLPIKTAADAKRPPLSFSRIHPSVLPCSFFCSQSLPSTYRDTMKDTT